MTERNAGDKWKMSIILENFEKSWKLGKSWILKDSNAWYTRLLKEEEGPEKFQSSKLLIQQDPYQKLYPCRILSNQCISIKLLSKYSLQNRYGYFVKKMPFARIISEIHYLQTFFFIWRQPSGVFNVHSFRSLEVRDPKSAPLIPYVKLKHIICKKHVHHVNCINVRIRKLPLWVCMTI